ncbi:MAG: tetrahydrofolate dehydrogenase/cyclohydrolase catalytic domain-containing protein [Flavobacteriales bacterium]|nr:tetrahydrofolate dehydrogenase/cyclohydrolase catalytic domain-containing protein [Flavobacteriales bacterium]MDG2086186.1 tetrahydrofolate dehydrogenase/cyclohydrolase catalytic domain-containing protein [Flavobacteriales bacterium]|tara:strand:+ start:8955 stop:9833 length:879 start_codon:yes stop_codon:yes gene_type:complete
MILLDGKKTSSDIKDELRKEVDELVSSGVKKPHLAAILVGSNGASETYVGAKVKACEQVGFDSTLVRFNEDISELDLLNEINKINNNQNIDGLIVQLPLPNHIDELKVTQAINVEKDVDGFHPTNIGRMALNLPTYLPATPAGIMELLSRYNIKTSGKHCVVVGRSHIVGSPMSILMARNNIPGNCTVTLTHSRTKNLKEITRTADILIVALGKAQFINSEMIKDGACIIDVGINRVKSEKTKSGWKLLGDVDFDSVANMCSSITPVPGGVGPMTIAMLLKNTLKSAKNKCY